MPGIRIPRLFAGVMGYVEPSAGSEERDETVVGGVEVVAESIFPIERHLNGFCSSDIVEIENRNGPGEEFRVIGKGNDGVETGIVARPFDEVGIKAALGEDLFLGAVGEVVKDGDGRNFFVEGVMEAAGVNGHGEFAVFGDGPAIDPIGVAGETSYLFVFDGNFEEADRRLVVGIVDDFGIVFAFLLSLFVSRGIVLSGEDQRVFIEPVDAAGIAGEFGKRIRFAAVRADQPDLFLGSVGFVGFRVGARVSADEGDPFAVRRPLRERDIVGTAGELDGAVFGETGKEKIGNAGVFFLVPFAFDPDNGARIGRECEIVEGFLEDDVVGLPGRSSGSDGFGVVGEEMRSGQNRGGQ